MANLATMTAPMQFDFTQNNVERMTLATLKRTFKENDTFGNPQGTLSLSSHPNGRRYL